MTWISEILRSFAKPLQWWVIVTVWEQAVLVRLGKHTHHLMPGIHFRIPFLDRVVRVCVRERVIDVDSKTISTLDGRALTVGLSLRYSIVDLSKMVKNIARPETTVRSLAQAKAAEFVAKSNSKDVTPAEIQAYVSGELELSEWGYSAIQVYVTTCVYTRTIRLLQAQDNGFSSRFDGFLDRAPATVD